MSGEPQTERLEGGAKLGVIGRDRLDPLVGRIDALEDRPVGEIVTEAGCVADAGERLAVHGATVLEDVAGDLLREATWRAAAQANGWEMAPPECWWAPAGPHPTVPAGWEAARSTGLSFIAALGYVVLPQAIRLTVAPLTNRTIAITKNAALGTVIGVGEILNQATTAQSFSGNATPLMMGAIAYVILFIPVVALGRFLETRFAWRRS